MKKYLLIDTNILVQCCLLQVEGDNLEVLRDLLVQLNKNRLTLLVPDVVEDELEKVLKIRFEKIKKTVGKYKGEMMQDADLKGDAYIQKELISKIDEVISSRRKNIKKLNEEIKNLFFHKNALRLKSTRAVYAAFRNSLQGKKPSKITEDIKIPRDSLIIETARIYLSKSKDKYKFFLCSMNHVDFAYFKNGKYMVSGDIDKKFRHIKYYPHLLECLNKEFGAKYSRKAINKISKLEKEIEKYFLQAQSTSRYFSGKRQDKLAKYLLR